MAPLEKNSNSSKKAEKRGKERADFSTNAIASLRKIPREGIVVLCLVAIPAIALFVPSPTAVFVTAIAVFSLQYYSRITVTPPPAARVPQLKLVETPAKAKHAAGDSSVLNRHVGVLQFNGDGTIVNVNYNGLTHSGHQMKTLLQIDTIDAFFASSPTKKKRWWDELRHQGQVTLEVDGLGEKEGEAFRWLLHGFRSRNENSDTYTAILEPVSELKESSRLRSERLQSIGTLAGGIAHDVNNALVPILFGAEMIEQEPMGKDTQHLASVIRKSAERVQSIMRQILLFVGGFKPGRDHVDLARVIRDTEDMLRHGLPKGIKIGVTIPHDLWGVIGEEIQISQVLMNLCLNARDAMSGQGNLSVSVTNVMVDDTQSSQNTEASPGPHVLLQIEDTGGGIPSEIINKIFDPFFTTKGPGKGTGLGLSTVLGIVRAHGGFLSVSTQIGRGTKFKVWLPAVKNPEFRENADPFPVPRGRGEKILVIDDEPAVLEMTQKTLLSWGYRVVTASDGTEAVALVADRQEEIHLVLCDMMMPLMDGASTMRALQKIIPNVPMLAMSGLIEDMATSAKDAGAMVLLQKPFSARALVKTVSLFLEPARKTGEDS